MPYNFFFQALISQPADVVCIYLRFQSYLYSCYVYHLWGILRTHSVQLADGLIAQLVEHCNGIAGVMAWV